MAYQINSPAARSISAASTPSILTWVLDAISNFPDEVAISWGDTKFTYSQLGALTQQIKARLLDANLSREALVVLSLSERWMYVPAILGCIAAGVAFVPIDSEAPWARTAAMIEGLHVSAVVVDPARGHTQYLALPVRVLEAECLSGRVASLTWQSPLELSRSSTVSQLGYVYFTSGSTGTPKAIAGKLLGVDAFISWEIAALGLPSGVRVSQLGSPAFDGFLKDIFVPLCCAGTICVATTPDLLLSPERLAAWLAREEVAVFHTVPSVLRQLFSALSARRPLLALTHIVLAGEQVLPRDAEKCFQLFGDQVKVVNLYGPTETTLTKTYHFLTRQDIDEQNVPIGLPMPGTTVQVVDDHGIAVPAGQVGEIAITTGLAALGYLGAEGVMNFTTSSEVPEATTYRTGDWGRQNGDGELECLGRMDNQIKVRGVRIEMEEIEAAFAQHTSVVNVAAVPKLDSHGDIYLACYCAVADATSVADLYEHVRLLLPGHMLPSVIETLPALPLAGNGKIDRQKLAERPVCQIPANAATSTDSLTEQTVKRSFSDVLGYAVEDKDASFFVLGGHSLLAMRLLARVYKDLGCQISLRDLFKNSSIRAFSALIDKQG